MSKPRDGIRWWGRLESRVIAALAALGILCVGASAYLVGLSVAYFDGRWATTLEQARQLSRDGEGFHRRLVAATIDAYEARTQVLALELGRMGAPVSPPAAEQKLDELLAQAPDLVELRWQRGDGHVTRVARDAALPEDRYARFDATAPVVVPPGGGQGELQAVFAIDPTIDDSYQQLGERRRALAVEQRELGQIERAVTRVVGLASAVVLLLAIAIGFVIARTTTRKVSALSVVMERVRHGDLSARAVARGTDELGRLGQAFNHMLDELAVAQARVSYLQRIGAWQEMARRIAHEIKNPLTPILLAVQQLRDKDPGLSPEFTRMLHSAADIVQDEIAGLRRMVTSFSQFARVPEVRLARVCLATVLSEFERAYGHLSDHAADALVIAAPPAEVEVLADRQLLKQVLINLVENALLSAREAGRAPVRVDVTAERLADSVELRVDDNGPGVPPDRRERVFEPYETTRNHGTGLGLAIVKKIILDHGGEVWVEDGPLGGARFVIRLRLAPPGHLLEP